jgi:hypothetical protein
MSTPEMPKVMRAPEWVGDGDARRDVSMLTDRGLALMGLDLAMRTSSSLKVHSDKFLEFLSGWEKTQLILLQELPDHERRITAIEAARLRAAGHVIEEGPRSEARPLPQRPEAFRDDKTRDDLRQSSHEWDAILTRASADLTRRVKDPRDKMDSNRARTIAQEVVKSVQTDADAQAFRAMKSRGWAIAIEILKILAAAVIGGIGVHYGLKG